MLTHLQFPPKLPARVVILGAAGFVAGAVERRLSAKAGSVLALPRAALDLTNVNSVDRLAGYLRPDDALLFAAAKAPVKNEEMLIENIRMGATVCAALRKSPVKHIVYISSDAIYADTVGGDRGRRCFANHDSLATIQRYFGGTTVRFHGWTGHHRPVSHVG